MTWNELWRFLQITQYNLMKGAMEYTYYDVTMFRTIMI